LLQKLIDEWQKFADENGEKNRLLQELKELIEKIGNSFDELKWKHVSSTDKSKKI